MSVLTVYMIDGQKILLQYQHGNVIDTGEIMSIIFVFRVVDEYCDYDENNNIMIVIGKIKKPCKS